MFLQLLVIITVSGETATGTKGVEESMFSIYIVAKPPPLFCNLSFCLQTFQHASKDAAPFKRSPHGSSHQGENVVNFKPPNVSALTRIILALPHNGSQRIVTVHLQLPLNQQMFIPSYYLPCSQMFHLRHHL